MAVQEESINGEMERSVKAFSNVWIHITSTYIKHI